MKADICERIGVCKVDAEGNLLELRREFFGQGWVFKDWGAFRDRPDAPCYVPELDDTVYTRRDFLELCSGQEEIAEELFDQLDWQSPRPFLMSGGIGRNRNLQAVREAVTGIWRRAVPLLWEENKGWAGGGCLWPPYPIVLAWPV